MSLHPFHWGGKFGQVTFLRAASSGQPAAAWLMSPVSCSFTFGFYLQAEHWCLDAFRICHHALQNGYKGLNNGGSEPGIGVSQTC